MCTFRKMHQKNKRLIEHINCNTNTYFFFEKSSFYFNSWHNHVLAQVHEILNAPCTNLQLFILCVSYCLNVPFCTCWRVHDQDNFFPFFFSPIDDFMNLDTKLHLAMNKMYVYFGHNLFYLYVLLTDVFFIFMTVLLAFHHRWKRCFFWKNALNQAHSILSICCVS
jgi:hypothetical protein